MWEPQPRVPVELGVGVALTQHVCLSKRVVLEGIVYKEKEKHKWVSNIQ